MATVNYGFSIQVSGGPQIANTRATTLEAYEIFVGRDATP